MKQQLSLALALAWGLPVLAAGQQTLQLDDEQSAPPSQTPLNDQSQPERREAGFRGTSRTPRAQGQQDELVGYLAAKLQLANEAEIQLATLATQQAEKPEVKKFAQMLVEDHRRLNEQLAQAVPGLRQLTTRQRGEVGELRELGEPSGQDQAPRQSDDQNERSAQNSRQGSGGQPALTGVQQELIAISRRAVDNQLQMTSEMLRKKKGANFDQCFLHQQVGAHIWLLSELQAIRDAGPAEFSQIVQQAEQSTQQHLEQAKELVEKNGQGSSVGNDRQDARRQQRTQRDSIE